MFDIKTNKAICVIPWVQKYKNISGLDAPCCHSETFDTKENIEVVKSQMLKGIKPRVCKGCYKNEEQTSWSYRILETNTWLKRHGAPDLTDPKIEWLDLRYNPTCNMKCKICGPLYSTLWQKEKGLKIKTNHDSVKILHNTNKKHLKKVVLAGGEPTYIKEYLEFLDELEKVNADCEIILISNLKKLPDAWKEIICKFKNLTVVCSLDAIEDLGCYVRYPLEWKSFVENVDFVSKNANFLQWNPTAYNLTAHKLYETCLWMSQYSKAINLNILYKPQYFSEHAVPHEQRNAYVNNLEKLQKIKIDIHYAVRFRSEIKQLIQMYANNEYNEKLRADLVRELDQQDTHRSLKLKDVDQFLYSWIYR